MSLLCYGSCTLVAMVSSTCSFPLDSDQCHCTLLKSFAVVFGCSSVHPLLILLNLSLNCTIINRLSRAYVEVENKVCI